jgi:RND family efflux transporter MFP subunit
MASLSNQPLRKVHAGHQARKTLRFTCLVVLSLSLFLSGCLGIGNPSAQTSEEATPTPLPTTPALAKPTYTVERGEVGEQVDFQARISPALEEELAFRTDGFVKTIYISESGQVKAGDVLIELEGIEELERQSRLNELDQRKVEINAEIAQYQYELFLLDTPTWSFGYEQKLAIEQRQLELAQIAIEESTLYAASLAEQVTASRLLAPFDGQMLYLNVSEGDRVSAYDPIGILADVSVLEASATLPDDVMADLEEGMAVVVIGGGQGAQRSLEGTIRYLPYPYGSSKPGGSGTNDRNVHIELSQTPDTVGMELSDRVRVEVVIERHTDVLWLPPQAVRQFQGRNFVVVQDGGLQRRVDVTLGIQAEERWEILDGLEEGWIVVGP